MTASQPLSPSAVPPAPIRVLFVDDELSVLQGLENRLRRLRGRWDMRFAVGGHAALEQLGQSPFDVVVSDMRMPGMDGAELLTKVRDSHPRVVRVILTGHAGTDGTVRVLPVAQQMLSKPCEADALERAVEQSCALQRVLHGEPVQRAIGMLKSLPALPRLYWKLVREVENPRADARSLAAIIQQDVAMSARVLQVANSAFFAPRRPFRHVQEAVTYLGILAVRSMVLTVELFRGMSELAAPKGFSLEKLQAQSLKVAQIAYALLRNPEDRQTAYSAGMLHDIGKLALAVAMPDKFSQLGEHCQGRPPSIEEERQFFGCAHTEVGAHLLSLWGLPTALIEAVAYHHTPTAAGETQFGPVGAIHVAAALAVDPAQNADGANPDCLLDDNYLRAVGVADTLDAWRQRLEELKDA